MGGRKNFQPVHISKLCTEKEIQPIENLLDTRVQKLNELFDQEPWVIQHRIYQNYTERAIYLNEMMKEAKVSFENLRCGELSEKTHC